MTSSEKLNQVVEFLFSKISVYSLDGEDELRYSLVDACVALLVCPVEAFTLFHDTSRMIRVTLDTGTLVYLPTITQDELYRMIFSFQTEVTEPIHQLFMEGVAEQEHSTTELWEKIAGINPNTELN